MITKACARVQCVTLSTLFLRVAGLSSLSLFMLAGFALSTRFMG